MAIQQLHELLNELVKQLFEPEDRRIDKMIVELDAANRQIKGHKDPGFMHAGEVYVPQGKRRPSQVPSLAFTLTKGAADFMAELKQITDDRQLIKQMLWLVTKDCETPSDVRNALPEHIVGLADQLKSWPRTNEDGYTVSGNPRLYAQYVEIRDKVNMYWACRMLY